MPQRLRWIGIDSLIAVGRCCARKNFEVRAELDQHGAQVLCLSPASIQLHDALLNQLIEIAAAGHQALELLPLDRDRQIGGFPAASLDAGEGVVAELNGKPLPVVRSVQVDAEGLACGLFRIQAYP